MSRPRDRLTRLRLRVPIVSKVVDNSYASDQPENRTAQQRKIREKQSRGRSTVLSMVDEVHGPKNAVGHQGNGEHHVFGLYACGWITPHAIEAIKDERGSGNNL